MLKPFCSFPSLRAYVPTCLRAYPLVMLLACSVAWAADKPRIAVMPIAGDGAETLRERAAFSLRVKLDRSGKYEVVDGIKAQEAMAELNAPASLNMDKAKVIEFAKLAEADLVIWGELNAGALNVKIADLRQPDFAPLEVKRSVAEPTDLRFAVEEILSAADKSLTFAHPVEESVWDDPLARQMWEKNPNLLANGDFSAPGKWTGIYQSELYPVPQAAENPPQDKVAIVNGVLVLHLSKNCAENNGLAALSDSFPIEPNTRYRISYRYRSDGPHLHVFVKGYTMFPSPTGKVMEREIYRRQVPPSGQTHGQWVTIVDDFNPQHISLPVQTLKVDLYTYLHPGIAEFDDVIVKKVGAQTRQGKDDAIKAMTTRPTAK